MLRAIRETLFLGCNNLLYTLRIMVSFTLRTVLFCGLTTCFGFFQLPSNYQSLTADEKQDLLWRNIQQNPYPTDNLPIRAPSLWTIIRAARPSFLAKAFTHTDEDEMVPKREKVVHYIGASAKATFRIHTDSLYTGIFRPGNYCAILRSSIGATIPNNFIPGAAIKILLDGKPSVNMFAMYSLDGQGANRNYFANNFATTIPKPKSFAIKALSQLFRLALYWIPGGPDNRPENEANIPLYVHAQVNEEPGADVVAPYLLTFKPNPAVGWDANDPTDFRIKLGQIESGTKLWDVSARRAKDGIEEPIGEVVLDSQFVASPYQDEMLYFQHPSARWRPH